MIRHRQSPAEAAARCCTNLDDEGALAVALPHSADVLVLGEARLVVVPVQQLDVDGRVSVGKWDSFRLGMLTPYRTGLNVIWFLQSIF